MSYENVLDTLIKDKWGHFTDPAWDRLHDKTTPSFLENVAKVAYVFSTMTDAVFQGKAPVNTIAMTEEEFNMKRSEGKESAFEIHSKLLVIEHVPVTGTEEEFQASCNLTEEHAADGKFWRTVRGVTVEYACTRPGWHTLVTYVIHLPRSGLTVV